jgi:hypothetical protein
MNTTELLDYISARTTIENGDPVLDASGNQIVIAPEDAEQAWIPGEPPADPEFLRRLFIQLGQLKVLTRRLLVVSVT